MTLPAAANPASPDLPAAAFDNRDLSSRVYQVLQQDILQGQLPPGARLSLDDLAERFGISVSPIRDALRLLAADGLVELRSRRGAFVTQPSRAVIDEQCRHRPTDLRIRAGQSRCCVEVSRALVTAVDDRRDWQVAAE